MKKICSIFLCAALVIPALSTSGFGKNKNKKEKEVKVENHLTDLQARKLTPFAFPLPDSLKPNFEFWKLIYSKYDKNQIVIHDTENLSLIYSVVDLNQSSDFDLSKKGQVGAEKERIRGILLKLASGVDEKSLSAEEQKIFHLFDKISNPNKFAEAAAPGRIRGQTGQKDKFLNAITWSGSYLQEIEEVFRSQGLPFELSRIPFVESMFNLKARSKVGASGIWQFMPSTGKLYMTVNGTVDERNDPITSAYAAARLLKSNYDLLGTWPLAINAYNAGPLTLARAKEAMGTDDIGVIASSYRGGAYQFASRNFYTEFLAALEVANHYKDYFGELPRNTPFKYETLVLDRPTPLPTLANLAGADVYQLEQMNPALADRFFENPKALVPTGYSLKIPAGSQEKFAKALQEIENFRVASKGRTVAQKE